MVRLLLAEDMEKTYQFKQNDIVKELDIMTQEKTFSLNLEAYGPYHLDYTRNGAHLLIGGRKGHVATFNAHHYKMGTELHLGETIRNVK
jgi:U3 small nucleolar RNA-associated protein 7